MNERIQDTARRFRTELATYKAVMQDPRCPRVARWLLAGAFAYAISPIDLIPDFIPILGHLDDLIILPLLVWLALRLIPKALIDEHGEERRRS